MKTKEYYLNLERVNWTEDEKLKAVVWDLYHTQELLNHELCTASRVREIIGRIVKDYSDQQNKDKDAEIQRLMKELDEVKTSHYQKLDAQLVEDVERLTEENKELREKVKALDDHRIKIEEMELTERNRANKADAEIQRLTKEVEWLKRFKAGIHSEELIKELGGMMNADKKLYESILDSPASFHFNNICNRVRTQEEKLTRLRELLGRANKLLNWNDVSAKKLYDEINQTLKP